MYVDCTVFQSQRLFQVDDEEVHVPEIWSAAYSTSLTSTYKAACWNHKLVDKDKKRSSFSSAVKGPRICLKILVTQLSVSFHQSSRTVMEMKMEWFNCHEHKRRWSVSFYRCRKADCSWLIKQLWKIHEKVSSMQVAYYDSYLHILLSGDLL